MHTSRCIIPPPPFSLQWDKARERLIQDGQVAHVGRYHYALPCFPGVVHIPMKGEKDVKDGGAAAAGGAGSAANLEAA